MPISAKWKHKSSIHIGFIVFNGGVTTFFAKSVLAKQYPNLSFHRECHLKKYNYGNPHLEWKFWDLQKYLYCVFLIVTIYDDIALL